VLRTLSYVALVLGVVVALGSALVVVNPGEVGVRHAFGFVDPKPLLAVFASSRRGRRSSASRPVKSSIRLPGIRSRKSRRCPANKWNDRRRGNSLADRPAASPRIYTEIGTEDQIHSAVRNAIRKGVRDAMVQYSINDIAKRTKIATTMEALVDSALVTQPRAGGPPFRIATVTAFFLRDLQPPAQVVQAINNKIAQEQQVETERHRVEVARLQAEQQRLLNTTLTPEALTRQYFDVLRELKSSNNLVILVPTQGGIPMLNIGDLRRNLRQP